MGSNWTSTMHLRSQTSRTDTNRLHNPTSFLLFHTPTAQDSRLSLIILICPTIPRSEARTRQMLIAAEEKTSNPTPKMLTKFLPVYPQSLSSLFCFTVRPPLPNLHQLPLIFFPQLLASSWRLPPLAFFTQITSPITHQWSATYPLRSAAILLQLPARTQTP